MAPEQIAAVGFRARSGWAAFVVLGGRGTSVVRRGHIELANRGVYRQGQPYHAAAEMRPDEAREFLAESAQIAQGMAESAIRQLLDSLSAQGYRVRSARVLEAAGRPLPELPKILAAHPLIHTAEGEFFRNAIAEGCAACGIPACRVKERDLVISRRIEGMGKWIGPPWRKDEKLCAAAAWNALHP